MPLPLLLSLAGALECLRNGLPIRPRTVVVRPGALEVTVYELSQPRELVEAWMTEPGSAVGALGSGPTMRADPFGVVLWPGAHLAARELDANAAHLRGRVVTALGVGTGLEALAAAQLGAARVIACDVNPLALSLLKHAAEAAGVGAQIEPRAFDLLGDEPVPEADVLVGSDLLYNDELAAAVGRRCGEALCAAEVRAAPLSLLVTDSQRFSGGGEAFTSALGAALRGQPSTGGAEAERADLGWQEAKLQQITGSGILIEEDQTYDVDARFISRWPATARGTGVDETR